MKIFIVFDAKQVHDILKPVHEDFYGWRNSGEHEKLRKVSRTDKYYSYRVHDNIALSPDLLL